MQIDLQCQFINPLIEYSKKSLHFQINKKASDVLEIMSKEVILKNVSSLPVIMDLRTTYPFAVGHASQLKLGLTLAPSEKRIIHVLFDPIYRADYLSRKINNSLTIDFLDHPNFDSISLSAGK